MIAVIIVVLPFSNNSSFDIVVLSESSQKLKLSSIDLYISSDIILFNFSVGILI